MFSAVHLKATKKQDALPLAECIAKTYTIDGKKSIGRTVLSHCTIVGAVACELMARMPVWLREALFPEGSELVAASHDTGKVSPTFQEKIYRGAGYPHNSFPQLEDINPSSETEWGGHGGVSHVALKKLNTGKYIPEIVGQHHGYTPPTEGKLADDKNFGGPEWQTKREELVGLLKQSLKADWPVITSSYQARVLAGLTTVSDWIGSSAFFEDPTQPWEPNICKALDHAGFVQPKIKSSLSFEDIFGFSPREPQKKLIEHASQAGVYILEAPMGLGKTEAALYAAYRGMESGQATGIYFALPTQLTSDKIHVRVNEFLTKILDDDCRHKKALLLHGNAWLKETDMGEEGLPGGSWFQGSKRGILAPFAVGTIDQALMAVMNVKHGFVRAFGLAGKVVILDEVHSYDSYTGTILDNLVKALGEFHCTVIILSATLTRERRACLLDVAPVKNDYPLISAMPRNQPLKEITVTPASNSNLSIQMCGSEKIAIAEILLRAEQGQQILWIENTVAEAQEKFKLLAAKSRELGIECGLLHSRFVRTDRDRNETRWVRIYGKDNVEERRKCGRILVGTQVVEQSLDIDADFLVTRMCPTDMLLQRFGRLWRHGNTSRPDTAVYEAWILAPTLHQGIKNPEKSFGKTACIYSAYVLCRSLEVWANASKVSLPGDIRSLMEATYKERLETGEMVKYKNGLLKKREVLQQFALIGISQASKTLSENRASTRYDEQVTVEVLLLRNYRHDALLKGTLVTLLDGEEIYLPKKRDSQNRSDWKRVAAKLLMNTVRVSEKLAPNAVHVNELAWLKDYFYLGDPEKEESLLRVAKVSADDQLIGLNLGSASSTLNLFYNDRLGYRAEKLNNNKAEYLD